jgi:hypothetical protein
LTTIASTNTAAQVESSGRAGQWLISSITLSVIRLFVQD